MLFPSAVVIRLSLQSWSHVSVARSFYFNKFFSGEKNDAFSGGTLPVVRAGVHSCSPVAPQRSVCIFLLPLTEFIELKRRLEERESNKKQKDIDYFVPSKLY